MHDVITIGSAFQDLYLFSKNFHLIKDKNSPTGEDECFALGSKIEVEKILREVGGGATNTAATFANLGLKVACVVKVGDDPAGDEIINALKKYKIDPQFIIRDPHNQTALSIFFLAKTGERTILVYRGASADFHEQLIPWQKMKAKWYYVSSLGGNLKFLEHAINHAKKQKAKIALNPGKLELAKAKKLLPIIKKADVVLLNREEAELLFKLKGEKLIKKISGWCCGIFVMTDGENGSWAITPKVTWQIKIKPVKAADTTGAGDAYGSAFVAGLLKKPGNLEYALKLASTNSAAEVKILGAKKGLMNLRTSLLSSFKVRKLRI
jgi:sugar/nucleoside kinase (ribokinase family)